MAREALLAFLFGTSQVAAANRIAQTAIASPLNLLTTDALSGAFLPIEARLVRADPSAGLMLYRASQALLMLLGILLVPVFVVWGGNWIDLIAPGSASGVATLASSMLLASAVGAPSYFHYNVLAYLEMAHGGFRLSSIRSIGQSIGLIIGTALGYVLNRPSLLAGGFSAAYVVMSAWAVLYVRRMGYLPHGSGRPHIGEAWLVVRPVVARLGILIWLPILNEVQLVTEKMLLSRLNYQVVAAADYARLVTDTGVLLLATPIGLASLPTFAMLADLEVRPRLLRVLEPFLLVGLGTAAVAYVFAEPIVRLLYGRGAFNAESVRITYRVLQGLCVGLWAQFMNYFLIKIMNARSRNLVSIGVVGISTIVTVSSRPWLVQRSGYRGVGLAVSAGAVAGLIFGCFVLGVLRLMVLDLLLLLPALCFTVWAAYLSTGVISWHSLGLFCGLCIAWSCNVLVVPHLRHVTFSVIRDIRRKSTAQMPIEGD